MMKRLRQEEKKDEQSPERKGENKNETVISSKSFFASLSPVELKVTKQKFFIFRNGKEKKMPRFVFHPPSV